MGRLVGAAWRHRLMASANARLMRPRRRLARVAAAIVVALVAGLGCVPVAAADAQIDEWWLTRLSASAAAQLSQGEGVVVGVVDSGVIDAVPQLRGQVLPGYDAYDGSTDGRSDPGTRQLAPGYTTSHGTEMAMLIAGRADSNLVGIAPRARILPVRVGPGGSVPTSAVAAGIRWAVDHGASVINLSLSGGSVCDAEEGAAVAYAYRKGVIVVAAAGNDPGPVESPANCPGALAVTASTIDFAPWPTNATGPQVAFTAPGTDMHLPTLEGGDHTAITTGTSGATALVSGVFALLRARFPDAPARDLVTRALYATHNGVDGIGRIDDRQGYGAPLPAEAMQLALTGSEQNPIYDAFDRQLASAAPSASPTSGASTAPSPMPTPDPMGASPMLTGDPMGASGPGVVVVSPEPHRFPLLAVCAAAYGVSALILIIVVLSTSAARRSRRALPTNGSPPWASP